jgi:ribosomal protein S18 acetylase RimI-like enzyme
MYEIRRMTRDELDFAVDWAAAEGWNPGLDDSSAFYTADPEGFLIGLLDGEPVGSISAVKYGSDFGFLGFYIVRPEFRGRGYGLQLWQEAMRRFQAENIGLDGVLAQEENYRRSGFRSAYHHVRYRGIARAGAESAALTPISDVPFDGLLAYDASIFPAERAPFLRAWLGMNGSAGLAALQDGGVHGYGVTRACREGYKVGPLFAGDRATAEALLSGLAARLPDGAPLFLDVPQANAAAVVLAEERGMEPVFETVRMYTRGEPDRPLQQVYGVTSLELG